MEIRPVRAELFHAGGRTDGQTYVAKLIVALRNFGRAPNNRRKIDLKKAYEINVLRTP
jgi:hypothetical protein